MAEPNRKLNEVIWKSIKATMQVVLSDMKVASLLHQAICAIGKTIERFIKRKILVLTDSTDCTKIH